MITDEPFYNTQSFIIILVPVITSYFVYGVYSVLFGLCVFFLVKRKRPRTAAHVTITVLLFALATIGILLQTLNTVSQAGIALQFSSQTSQLKASSTGALMVLIMTNIVADILLTWRCYLVWSSRIKFVVLPAVLCILNNVAALVIALVDTRHSIGVSELSNVTQPALFVVFLYGALVSNVVLTTMIAGRIYYVIRNDLTLLGPQVQRMYKTAVAVSIESGILYPIALAIEAAILPTMGHVDPAEKVELVRYRMLAIIGRTMYLLLTQIVGIAPTLIIIRIGLGYCVVDGECGGLKSRSDRRTGEGDIIDINREGSTTSPQLREPDSEVLDISSTAINGQY